MKKTDFLNEITNQLPKTWAEAGTQALKGWFDLVKSSLSSEGEPELKSAAFSTSKSWIELNNFCWNLMYEKTLGGLMQTPLLGASRGFNSKLMQVFDAWAKLYPTNANYQVVLAEIQIQSLEKLLQELILLTEKGESIENWSQLQQLWSRAADEVFEAAFCLEDNLKVRGRLLNAVNHHKLCQQELMEVGLNMLNLPTRSEVDEVHKNIYELRKEVKRLKKTLAQ